MPVISFKVSPADARAIRARARARRTTVSEYLRTQALPHRQLPARLLRKRHPRSGLTCDAAPGPAVTAEDILAALVDFP